ncbi:MAG: alpha/beta hydrolase [Bacteroidota bacterium]
MPGLQHTLLQWGAARLRKTASLEIEGIPKLRKVLDSASRLLFLPGGVTKESFQIGRIPAAWLRPQGADKDKVVLFLHGGGFAVGSTQTHQGLAARLAQKAELQCLIFDYRLAPEHPFPAGLEDAVASYQYLLAQGFEPGHIVLAGDSAGGGLALSLQVTLKAMGLPLPAACLLFSPWVDLSFSGASAVLYKDTDPIVCPEKVLDWALVYAGKESLRHPMVSPLFADLSGLSPTYIQASTTEVLTDDAIRLQRALKKAKVAVNLSLWEETMHVWQLFWGTVPEADKALVEGAAFLRSMAQVGISASENRIKAPHKS